MKHNKHHDNNTTAGPHLEPVHFEFTHPTAASVCIAGSFNDWQPEAKPMHPAGDGRWLKETVLAPGTYEYCLVVDGHWMADPQARDTVPNPFGGMNSLLKVTGSEGIPQVTVIQDKSSNLRPAAKSRASQPIPSTP